MSQSFAFSFRAVVDVMAVSPVGCIIWFVGCSEWGKSVYCANKGCFWSENKLSMQPEARINTVAMRNTNSRSHTKQPATLWNHCLTDTQPASSKLRFHSRLLSCTLVIYKMRCTVGLLAESSAQGGIRKFWGCKNQKACLIWTWPSSSLM